MLDLATGAMDGRIIRVKLSPSESWATGVGLLQMAPFFYATGRCDSGGSGAGAFLLAESSTSCSILTRDVVDVDWGSSLGAF